MKDVANPPTSADQDLHESADIAKLSAQHINWILPSAFRLPGWRFSSAGAEHLPFCYWLVEAVHPRLVVDITAGRPDSYLAFCQSIDRLNYGASCLGVAGIFETGGSDNDPDSLREYHDAHFSHFSRLADCAEHLLLSVSTPSIDLLHIDGRQAATLSAAVARKLLNQLSPRGLILVDQPEQLDSSWRRLLTGRVSFTINGKNNLQLSAADGMPGGASSLFGKLHDAEVAASMRIIFARLGSALRERALHRDIASFAARLEISLADQSAAADLVRQDKNDIEDDVLRLRLERENLVARIAVLEPLVEDFRAEVIRLQVHAVKADGELDRLGRLVVDRDREIVQFQQLLDAQNLEASRLQRLIDDRDREIRLATEEAALQHGEVDQLRAEADQRAAELLRSNQDLAQLRRHAAHVENDLNRIVESTAWRITGPFRQFLANFPQTTRILRRGFRLVWWTVSFQLFSRLKEMRSARHHASDHEPAGERPEPLSDGPSATPSLDFKSDARLDEGQSLTRVEHDTARIQNIENRMVELASIVELERHRVDFALLGTDGLLSEIEFYHKARAAADYKSAFSEREPLVSICVATMNRSDLLIERCLNSLVNQSYRNIQIIVVGDHCTDDTGSRIAQLRDDRISFHNLPSRGPYPPPGIDRWRVAGTNAINTALSMSEGQFIAHLDDDDSAAVDRIETLVGAAQQRNADFCWHPFWYERGDGSWHLLGDGRFELGQITTGSIFYHRYFKRFPWDVYAYRTQEPGDWNRLRKIRALRPNLHFVDRPLMFHYTEGNQPPFVRLDGESFLE